MINKLYIDTYYILLASNWMMGYISSPTMFRSSFVMLDGLGRSVTRRMIEYLDVFQIVLSMVPLISQLDTVAVMVRGLDSSAT